MHPFFEGIDFNEISSKNYEGNYKLMMQAFSDIGVDPDQIDSFDVSSGSLA